MDTMYQRSKIQEESLYYEGKKHDGSLPLIGVNTFLPKDGQGDSGGPIELIRSTEEEKAQQIQNVTAVRERGMSRADEVLSELQRAARARENTFEALIDAAKSCSLGQMSHALYSVGGEYRRNM